MSCRRSDRTRLVGCRIGDIAMRGCSRGCCPYPDSEISQNTRPYLLDQRYPISHNTIRTVPNGRTGLYYSTCMSSYRPKFFCPEPTCRRSIKPVYDPEKFEYRISEFQDWSVRPLANQSPSLRKAFHDSKRLRGSALAKQGSDELAIFRCLQQRYWNDPSSISEEEFKFLKARTPELWWTDFISRPTIYTPGINMVRCPSCGKSAVPVGSNFRIPKRKDEKAWKEIRGMIQDGEDMVAKFSFCATIEEHERMIKRALELRLENMPTKNPESRVMDILKYH